MVNEGGMKATFREIELRVSKKRTGCCYHTVFDKG